MYRVHSMEYGVNAVRVVLTGTLFCVLGAGDGSARLPHVRFNGKGETKRLRGRRAQDLMECTYFSSSECPACIRRNTDTQPQFLSSVGEQTSAECSLHAARLFGSPRIDSKTKVKRARVKQNASPVRTCEYEPGRFIQVIVFGGCLASTASSCGCPQKNPFDPQSIAGVVDNG